MKVALWGGTSSGKTTFLAALRGAVLASKGRWTMDPDSKYTGSANFLNTDALRLMRQRIIPTATDVERDLGFIIGGTHANSGETYFGNTRPERARTTLFSLHTRDFPGALFLPKAPDMAAVAARDAQEELAGLIRTEPRPDGGNASKPATWKELCEFLADCHAFIYLYDPTKGDSNIDYLDPVLSEIKRLKKREGRKLRQPFAACVSKFDNETVFRSLHKQGLIERPSSNRNGTQHPTVRDDRYREVFAAFDDSWTYDEIESNFDADRRKYFMISSLGFHKPPYKDTTGGDRDDWELDDGFSNDGGDKNADGEPITRSNIKPVRLLDVLEWVRISLNANRR